VHVAIVQTMTFLKETLRRKDNYDKICSENRQLNALFTRQQKDREKRRTRDKALKEARDKDRVEEEEHQAVILWGAICKRKILKMLVFIKYHDI